MIVVRTWKLGTAAAMALVLGFVTARFWTDSAEVPRMPAGLPVRELFPVLTSVVLTWPLVERWQEQLDTGTRPAWLISASRFASTQALSALSALVAAGGVDVTTLARCSIGASVAALLTPALGGRTGLALLLLGYGWLMVTFRTDLLTGADTTLPALGALVLGGGVYVLSAVRRVP